MKVFFFNITYPCFEDLEIRITYRYRHIKPITQTGTIIYKQSFKTKAKIEEI